ncbi:uncharacterized protein LOC123870911 [Maniola jurtina]|uniref:uncharacterized protein LOC123870911 n=1 Tax=Maniola jurtina TaxID=191418 RepID=UPI001E688DCB|nr:uncharacterized protein LOC123870911 [Maniola jurtina]
MIFYNYIFTIALIFTFLHKTATDTNRELVYSECGLTAPSPASIGLVFFMKINNTSDKNDYDVEIIPDECCLEEDEIDCDTLQIIGGCRDSIAKGETKTVKVIAPLLNQYERKGYCAVFVDSKSNNGHNKRDTIKINFDTTFSRNKFDSLDSYKYCEHKDEDPFNDCKPVQCDAFYNGKKPYFSRKVKRCVAVPPCVKDDDYDYPSVIYNPQTNRCLVESIGNEDLEYIKTSRKDNSKKRKPKDVLIIDKFHPNTTSIIHKDILIDDIGKTTTCKPGQTKFVNKDEVNCFKLFLKKYFVDNKFTLLILVLVIIVQCILIFTMFYCLSNTCCCCQEKKVIRKFFNYRQDASVTTPLINTSNIETETTEYQYVSESSNKADQKVKCYKACQKEKNNNVKKSMSDDILSKLLNRRDWKNFQPQASPETENKIEEILKITPINNQLNNLPKADKHSETKVVFEDEKTNNTLYKKQSKLVNVVDHDETLNDLKDSQEIEALSSEKEIKSLSYDHFNAGVTGYSANLAMTKDVFKDGKSKKGTRCNSIEKGAQAYFSNDSIDDFLSERGVIYLAGENMSKYTFSSGSNDMKQSLTSSGTSKTSKNFVKNILSLLHKKSKQSPSSDPGRNKDIDLELIHMSRASVYSSTNDSDCLKNLKKDSRTSF